VTPAERQREAVVERDADPFGHIACSAVDLIPDHACRGLLQCAHALPKAAVRNFQQSVRASGRREHPLFSADLEAVIFDPDCAFMLCATGIPGGHFRWDHFGERCFYDELPAHVHGWASKWGLGHRLADYYPARLGEAAA
jgi:hypothetical protein